MLGCIQSNLLYEAVGTWLLLAGTVGFAAMGIDKARAVGGDWRIREVTLFSLAFVGGALGMAVGSAVFHHKTSKLSFLAVLYLAVVAWLFVLQQIGFLSCLSTYVPH